MESKFFKAGNSNFKLKLASRPVASMNALLTRYIGRVNKKTFFGHMLWLVCFRKSLNKKIKVNVSLNSIQKCEIKDHSYLVPLPQLQPGEPFVNSPPAKWLSVECLFLKNGDIFSTVLDIINPLTKAL